MPDFADCMTHRGRMIWAALCREFGMKIKVKREVKVEIEAKIEGLEEIEYLMKMKLGRCHED